MAGTPKDEREAHQRTCGRHHAASGGGNPARKAAEEAAAQIAKAMQTPPKRGKVVTFQKAQA